MDNPYADLSKRELKDVQLRLFGELSNLRADSRSLRRRLKWTREELNEKRNELAAVQDALFRLTVIPFPLREVTEEAIVKTDVNYETG